MLGKSKAVNLLFAKLCLLQEGAFWGAEPMLLKIFSFGFEIFVRN